MKVRSFSSKNNRGLTLLIKDGAKIEETVPKEVLEKIGALTEFKSFDLDPNEQPRIGLDSKEAISSINTHGFYISGIGVRITES